MHTHAHTQIHTHTHAHTQTICDMGRTQGDLKVLCCIKLQCFRRFFAQQIWLVIMLKLLFLETSNGFFWKLGEEWRKWAICLCVCVCVYVCVCVIIPLTRIYLLHIQIQFIYACIFTQDVKELYIKKRILLFCCCCDSYEV